MSDLTVADTLKYANLQMAAEAFLVNNDGSIRQDLNKALTDGNLHASRFTDLQANEFLNQWTVVSQQIDTPTGFSGTLFQSKSDPNELVISFRSTEFVDDAVRDGKATNELEIKDTGFAWGQISDMETWYEGLVQDGLLTDAAGNPTKMTVTGYSLGGHLATAFNLLHGDEVVNQVVTFNGAGIGTVDAGYTLQGQLEQFQNLQNDPSLIEDAFTSEQMKTLYLKIKTNLGNGTWNIDQALKAVEALYSYSPETGTRLGLPTEGKWLTDALKDIKSLQFEAERVPKLSAGGDTNPNAHPRDVPNSEILAENLDYRLAVEIVSRHTESASAIGGIARAYGSKVYLSDDQLNRLIASDTSPAPQYEVVGDTNPSLIANSQYHLDEANEIRVPIEDQPLYRGGLLGDLVVSALDSGNIDLLQDGYSQKDFGDTHSLVLLVDSLNAQNALLQMVTPAQREAAAVLLKQIFAQSSYEKRQDGDLTSGSDQGLAAGDELENVVNALADLILGKKNDSRLKGSPDGNTWWRDTKDFITNPDGYTGRDDFYKKLDQIFKTPAFTNTLAGHMNLVDSSGALSTQARNSFAAYIALYTLSPFAFELGDIAEDALDNALSDAWGSVYETWEKDKTTLADHTSNLLNISDEWLTDRSNFLSRKQWFNEENKNPVNPTPAGEYSDWSPFEQEPTYYEDVASGYKIAQGTINDSTQRFIFGNDKNNADLTGGGVVDHLYGGGGNDVLSGLYDDDYLEGDDGDDTLNGGKSNDILNGGQGFDTYIFKAGDGSDTIIDSDGKGEIRIGDETLSIGKLISGSENLWRTDDDKYIFSKAVEADGSTTLTIFTKSSGDRIIIKKFGSTSGSSSGFARLASISSSDNMLGIQLQNDDSQPLVGSIFNGDQNPVQDSSGTYDYLVDAQGNVITDGSAAAGLQDRLFGNAEDNQLYGFGGNDILYAGAGDDLLDGGDGDDVLSAGGGADTLKGGEGNDYLFGSGTYMSQRRRTDNPYQPPQDVQILASGYNWSVYPDEIQSGDETVPINLIDGTTGWEVVDSGNYLYGGAGNDQISSGNGDDYAFGEDGEDVIWGMAGNDVVEGGTGNDALYGDGARYPEVIVYTPPEDQGNDYLYGGKGDDQLVGQGGSDILYGGDDNDKLWGDAPDIKDTPTDYQGEDYLSGGNGDDYLEGGGKDDELHGGADNDVLFGDATVDHLDGQFHGNDLLYGEDGNDSVTGGGGDDFLVGGEGDDSLRGDAADLASQYHGKDTLQGGAGKDYLDGGGNEDTLEGGDGDDTLYGDGDVLEDAQAADILSGGDGGDYLDGNGGDDKLYGDAGDDTMYGSKGDDTLEGGGGSDYIDGGDGDDVIAGGDGLDQVLGGDGDDVFVYALNDALMVDSTIESLNDSDGQNIMRFGGEIFAWDVTFDDTSLPGNVIVRYSENDYVALESGFGTISAFEFADGSKYSLAELIGTNSENSVVIENDAGDVVMGGYNNDTLESDYGHAIISGGQGSDDLFGSGGNNTYLYNLGDGSDGIDDESDKVDADGNLAPNRLVFGNGIRVDDLNLVYRESQDDFVIRFGNGEDGNTGDEIHIWNANPLDASSITPIDNFQFADGTVLSFEELKALGFSIEGNNWDDTVDGTDGNDVIVALGGDDYLEGGDGGDVYVYNWDDGWDDVYDTGGNTDTIRFGAGITFENLQLDRDGNDLYISLDGEWNDDWHSGSILIENQYGDPVNRIERFEFADGRIYQEGSGGADVLNGNDGNDIIAGGGGDDVLYGMGGDDVLYGQYNESGNSGEAAFVSTFSDDELGGNDVLYGGAGNDTLDGGIGYDHDMLDGGTGNDTYVFRWGAGSDEVIESGDVGNVDRILLDDVWLDDIELRREGGDLALTTLNGDRLLVHDYFLRPDAVVEYIVFADGSVLDQQGIAELMTQGTDSSEALIGTDDSNLVQGYGGDDVLEGLGGDDVLEGDQGSDLLEGGTGNDTYIFNAGDGADTIVQHGGDGIDRIVMGDGVLPSDIIVTRNETDLILAIRGSQDRIHVSNWFVDPEARIAHIEFAGDQATMWNAATLEAMAAVVPVASSQNDVLGGTAGDDIITALDGDDLIFGLGGNDVLDGGAGNDTIYGGQGTDTYRFGIGSGNDAIFDIGDLADVDTIELAAGITTSDVRVTRNESDLIVALPASGDSVTISGWYTDANQRIEALRFADSSVWDANTLETLANTPTEAADFIVGDDGNNALVGLSGDDTLMGRDGNDTLNGGAGSDILDGGQGDDIYLVTSTTQHELVRDAGGFDIVRVGDSISPDQVIVQRDYAGNLYLSVFGADTRIEIAAGDDGSGLRGIEQVEFVDGTVWDMTTLDAYRTTLTTPEGDSIVGSARGDLIDGMGGSDYADGLDGGDTYYFKRGYGYLSLNDSGSDSDIDTLVFGDDIRPSDLMVTRYDQDMTINLGNGDVVKLPGYFTASTIERFKFADGTELSSTEIGNLQIVPAGTDQGDTIYGSIRDDVIKGLGGNDYLFGGVGNDVIDGGDYNDYVRGDEGNDVLDGGSGIDHVYGGDGDDTLTGGINTGPDTQQEQNRLYGYSGDMDTLDGGAGNDTYVLKSGDGYDYIAVSDGIDTIRVEGGFSAEDIIIRPWTSYAYGQTYTLFDYGGGSAIGLNGAVERIESADGFVITADQFANYRTTTSSGTEGNDVINGSLGPNTIYAGSGDDVVRAGGGRDTVDGGGGNDALFGGSGSDTLTDGYGENILFGEAGNDVINGIGYLSGGSGNDSLSGKGVFDGGAGDDVLHVNDAGSTVIFGRGSGHDSFERYSTGSFTLVLSSDVRPDDVSIRGLQHTTVADPLTLVINDTGDSIANLNHVDKVLFGDGTTWTLDDLYARSTIKDASDDADNIAGTANDDVISGLGGNDVLGGNAGDDTLLGDAGGDVLYGDAGNDALEGGAGNDTLHGGDGNDVLGGGSGFDALYGDAGVDTYRLEAGIETDTVYEAPDTNEVSIVQVGSGVLPEQVLVTSTSGGGLRLSLTGSNDSLSFSNWFGNDVNHGAIEIRFDNGTIWRDTDVIAHLVASDGNDQFGGQLGDDVIDGLGGGDVIYARTGDDTVLGNGGSDSLYGQDGNDALSGGDGNDALYGGTGNDVLNGDAGDDMLYGGDGDDVLDGGFGDEVIDGQGGADTIVFGLGSGNDILYATSIDRLRFAPGITRSDVVLTMSGSNLVIGLRDSTDSLTLMNWVGDRMELAEFDDGTSWRFSERKNPIIGTSTADFISDAATSPFDDWIYGIDGNDTLRGGYGKDHIFGGAGNDVLYGGGGDVLDGGAGNDIYVNLEASDTVIFGYDSGQDWLSSPSSYSTIRFEDNVRPEDVAIAYTQTTESSGSTTSIGYFNTNEFGIQLKGSAATLSGFSFGAPSGSSFDLTINYRFEFADGTVWSGADILQQIQLSAQIAAGRNALLGGTNDDLLALSVTGYVFGGAGNDAITGSVGSDTLLGGSGNDALIGGLGNDRMSGGDGNDVLEGASGNDFLRGDGGANIYRFSPGFGNDIVSLAGDLDRLNFSGIRPDQLQFTLSGSSGLMVGWSGANDTITINNAFTLDGEGRHSVLAGIAFEDGTVWDGKEILRRTIMSTSGDDVVNGSAASDSLSGGSGADQLSGYAGQDRLSGGEGNDTLIGGRDGDSLQGGAGDDLLEGGIGGDLYYFSRGDGHDRIVDSDSTPDNLDTVLVDAALADVSISHADDDTIITILDTGDTLTIQGGEDALAIERIRFTDGNVIDPKTGSLRNDAVQFEVGSGEVKIDPDSSFDTLAVAPGLSLQNFDIGREGNDLLLAEGGDSVRFVGWFDNPSSPGVLQVRFADDTLLDFEQLSRIALAQHGTFGDDILNTPEGFSSTLMGDGGNDFLTGGDRDDVLDGGDGNDILDGGIGDDTLIGGSGDDTYVVDSAGDVVVESPAAGIDTLRILSASTNVMLSSDLENVELIGGGAVNIRGTTSDNRLVGNAAVNRIEGGAGNDVLDGGAAADVLVGGLGNDTYVIDNAGDSIVEAAGEGIDTVQSGVSYALSNPALENLALLGSTNINGAGNSNDNVIVGNSGNNQLTGLGGNDYLDGGAGADAMAGGVGNDVYIVENAGDSIVEAVSSGTDEARSFISFTLGANVENLTLLGSASVVATGNELNNALLGNTGNNTLIGNAGNDRLDGGAGNDVLRGGTGADTYVFGVGSGIDTIVENDTSTTLDVIEVGSGLAASDLAFHWSGNDLVIAIVNGTDRLTVKDFKLSSGKVEQLHFLSDGSVLDYSALTAVADETIADQTPILAQAFSDAQTIAGTSFSYAIPAGSFSDADVGDHLDLAATLSDGSALPAWLNFDASTGTFSGMPHIGDVGSIAIRVTATDWSNAAVFDVFNLNVILEDDTSPSVAQPLEDHVLVQHQAFSFSVSADTFFDPDSGDVLSYTARLSSGDDLPSWLSFDQNTLQFSGTPTASVSGELAVTVTATDTRGRTASDAMVLKLQDVNDAPSVSRLIADQVVVQGATIDMSIPGDTFTDPDGDAITLAATLQNGDPLPEWLNFDVQTGHLTGVAGNDAVGVTTVRLRAIDSAGASTYQDFNIVVGDVNDAPVVVDPISDQIAVEASDFKFKIPNSAFSDPDEGDSLTYAVEVLNAPQYAKSYFSYNQNTQEIIRIGSAGKLDYWDIGDWTFRVTAKDRLGLTVSDEFKLSVTAAGINHAPVIVDGSTLAYPATNYRSGSVEPVSAETGSQISFSVPLLSEEERAAGYIGLRFADVDGDTLNYSISPISGNPISNWSFDTRTGMLNFVAMDNRREYDWMVTAVDSAGASVSYTYVLTLNQDPVIQTLPNFVVTEDQPFSFVLPEGAIYDPDADTLSYTVQGFTTYVSGQGYINWGGYDAQTRTLYGTPGDYNVGNHTITFSVNDGHGGSATQNFSINVQNAYDAPRNGTPLSDVTAVEDSSLSINAASAFLEVDPGASLTYSASLANGDPLPAWLSINSVSGLIRGTPHTSDIGASSIVVRATDARGAWISDTFDLNVILANRNHQPILQIPLADQVYRKQQAFSFQLPAGTFTDVDANDSLSYRATLENGAPLPAWLTFNAATQTFSGTIPSGQTAPTAIKVYAKDKAGAENADIFSIAVDLSNAPPVLIQPISDQTATEDQGFSFMIPAGAFADPEGGELSYTASLFGGGALPTWLHFDAATRTFSGVPTNDDVDTVSVAVTVTDSVGANVSNAFMLTVVNVNDGPIAATLLQDREVLEDSPFSFAISELAFADIDVGDVLSYSATLGDGTALPDWLSFDATTRTFSGTSATPQTLSINVVARDMSDVQASQIFSLNIQNVNDAPALQNEIVDQSTNEDQPFSFTLPANTFLDEDVGDVLTLSATLADGRELPPWLRFDAATATFTGTPTNDDVGAIDIKVTVTDLTGSSTSDAFSLVIANINDAPVLTRAMADQTVNEDTPFSLTVPIGTFTDADADDVLSYSATLSNGGALPAWLQFDPETQIFSGTPVNGDVGLLRISLTATDLAGATAEQTFNLNVFNVNDAPVVYGETFTLDEDTPLTLAAADLVANDTDIDPNHDVLVITEVRDASNGVVTLNGDGSITFTPDANYNGAAGFNYTVSDGNGGFSQANLVLNVVPVNDAPASAGVFNNQTAQAGTGFTYSLPAAVFVDADGDMLEYAATLVNGDELPSWLSFDPDTQTFNGNPGAGSIGVYQIRITATDPSGASADLSFMLSVTNQAPVVSNDIAQVSEDDVLTATGNVLGNDYDPDGQLVAVNNPGVLHGLYGTLSLSVDGQYSYALNNASDAVQALSVGETVVDSFTYLASDGVSSTSGIVQVQVTGSNDVPITVGDVYALNEDTILSVPLSALLANDSDVDQGDMLTISSVANSDHGSAVLNQNGTVTFIPDANYSGAASFSYTVSDGNGGFSQADITLNVMAMNDAPVAAISLADQSVNAGSSFSYALPSGSFIDVDGDVLRYTATQLNGSALPAWLQFDATTQTFSGVPSAGNASALQIAVTAIDSAGAHASESFNLTVAGGNLSPVTIVDTASIAEDTWPCDGDDDDDDDDHDDDDDDDHDGDPIKVTGNVLANDYDPEGKSLRIANPDTMHGVYGTLTLNVDGKYRYDLDNDSIGVQSLGAGQTVVDAFAYLASDGSTSSLGTLQVSVSGKNDKPILVSQLADYKLVQNQDFSWQVPAGSFKDIDISDTLSYTAKLSNGNALPSWLKFDAATQTFSGHAPGTAGQKISIILTASDGHGGSSTVSDRFDINIVSSGQVSGPIIPLPVSQDDDCANDDGDESDSEHDDYESDDGDNDDDDGVCSISPAIHVDLDLLVQSSQNPGTGQASQEGNDAAVFAHWLSVDKAVADFLSKQASLASSALHLSDMNVDTALLKPVTDGFLGSIAAGGTNALSLPTSGFNPNKFTGLNEGVAYID